MIGPSTSTKNFNQKGFTRNFLALMNTREKQVQCCTDSSDITFSIRPNASLNDTFAATDYTVLFNTTLGNGSIAINPATAKIGNIKKISIDANIVTLIVTSGLIYGFGTPVTSYQFNIPGQSISFQSDGTNIYII